MIRRKGKKKKLSDETIEVYNYIDSLIDSYLNEGGSVIGILQDINERFRYLPEEGMYYLSEKLDIPVSRLYTLATFYKSFRLKPVGKHIISVCMGTACHVNGAPRILEYLERELNIPSGETTEDKKFTLETVNCLGACALGPLIVIDGEYHGKITQNKIKNILKKYEKAEDTSISKSKE